MASVATIEITPLMLACQNNNSDDVKAMLSKGAAVDAKDSNNRTALLYCAENIEVKCIELLLSYNAQINHQDKDGYSCLHLAVICGNITIVEYLIKKGADVNITDSEMHSAIHWSVVCGHDKILDFLLANNADPETADIHGAYPIHYAAQMCGQIDIWDESINRNQSKSLIILKKLIEQKVKIDVEDFDQRNAIIWAASSGSSEALLELFAAGSDPNKHEKDGLTALHCAASRGHLECMKILIEQCKTSVDIMDNNNCTPIFYAATLGQVSACNLLIKYGSNLHVQDCKGRTAYHCASAKGQLKCLKTLCKKNSNIWLRNRRGDYPIHEAYYNKQMECVYYLLSVIDEKKASKSSNIYDGRTILHLAAADNDLKLCKRLVADGVDINCLMKTSSNSFMTPYDIAVLKNAKEVAKYLKSLGGLVGSEVAEKYSDEIKKHFKDIIEHEKKSVKDYENDAENETAETKKSLEIKNDAKKINNNNNKVLNKKNGEKVKKDNEKDNNENIKEKDNNLNSKASRSIEQDKNQVKQTNTKNAKKSDSVVPIYDSEKTLVQTGDREKGKIINDADEAKKKRIQEAKSKKNEEINKKIDNLSGVYDTKSRQKDSNKQKKSDDKIEKEELVHDEENENENKNNSKSKNSKNKSKIIVKKVSDNKNDEYTENFEKDDTNDKMEHKNNGKKQSKNSNKANNHDYEKQDEKKVGLNDDYAETDADADQDLNDLEHDEQNKKNSKKDDPKKRKESNDELDSKENEQKNSDGKKKIESKNEENKSRKNENEKQHEDEDDVKETNRNGTHKDYDSENKHDDDKENRHLDVDEKREKKNSKSNNNKNRNNLVKKNDSNFKDDSSQIQNDEDLSNMDKKSVKYEKNSSDFNHKDDKKSNGSKSSKDRTKKIIIKTSKRDDESDYDDLENDYDQDEEKNENKFNDNSLPDINKNKRNININRKYSNNNSTKNKKHDLFDDTSSPERNSLKGKFKPKQPASENLALSSKNRFKERSNYDRNRSYSNDESTVRLIIKPDDIKSYALSRKKFGSLFDKQRLVLKSLYEIRRCRINNRDIIINSELNNLLIKQYDFDIKKNCRSLKELEKMLELIAFEISDGYKKQHRRSHTLLSFKSKSLHISHNNNSKSYENIVRNDEKKALKTSEENLRTNRSHDTPNSEYLRLKQERQTYQNDQLKSAYRSLLPNDIYKQYYNSRSNTKMNPNDKHSTKEKTILLPVITQKPSFTT